MYKKRTLLIAGMMLMTPAMAKPKIDIHKIIRIESSGNAGAYNKHSRATGLCQITPICLADYNQYHTQRYTMREMFEPANNIEVAEWYLNIRIPQLLQHYKKDLTEENILIAYNAGIGFVGKKLPLETKNYIKKYKK